MKKYKIGIVSLLILAGVTGCSKGTENVPTLLDPVEVKLDEAKAEVGNVFGITTVTGEVVPYVEELHFNRVGSLKEVYVALGQEVKAGDVLAELDTEAVESQIKALTEEMDHIRKLGEYSDANKNIEIEIAKLELTVLQEEAAEEEQIAAKELEIRKLELSLKQERELRDLELQEKQRKLGLLEGQLKDTKLVAPFDGRIVFVTKTAKGTVVENEESLIYVADDTRVSLSTDYISELELAGKDKMYAKISDKEYNVTYQPYDATELLEMTLAGEEIDTKFLVEDPNGELKAGQFAVIVLLEDYKENVLTIPANALYRGEGGYYVYKIENGQRIRCEITVGIVTATRAEVEEGLKEGDVVYVKE